MGGQRKVDQDRYTKTRAKTRGGQEGHHKEIGGGERICAERGNFGGQQGVSIVLGGEIRRGVLRVMILEDLCWEGGWG